MAQWLRVRLPMQGTRVRALVREDPTCRGTTGPVEPWPLSLCARSLCSAMGEATTVRGPRTAKKQKNKNKKQKFNYLLIYTVYEHVE